VGLTAPAHEGHEAGHRAALDVARHALLHSSDPDLRKCARHGCSPFRFSLPARAVAVRVLRAITHGRSRFEPCMIGA
jgi:hypothetical protein